MLEIRVIILEDHVLIWTWKDIKLYPPNKERKSCLEDLQCGCIPLPHAVAWGNAESFLLLLCDRIDLPYVVTQSKFLGVGAVFIFTRFLDLVCIFCQLLGLDSCSINISLLFQFRRSLYCCVVEILSIQSINNTSCLYFNSSFLLYFYILLYCCNP